MPAQTPKPATPDTATPDTATPDTAKPARTRKPRAERTPRTTAPEAAHALIAAIKAALAADVPAERVTFVLDLALSAEGDDRPPLWKASAKMLDAYVNATSA